jgi:hypothetical protein
MYRPSVRRIPGVRQFIDFVTGIFREIELQQGPATRVVGTTVVGRSAVRTGVGGGGAATRAVAGYDRIRAYRGCENVAKLNAAVREAIRSKEMTDAFAKIAVEPGGESPQECASLVAAESLAWSAIVKASGFVGED